MEKNIGVGLLIGLVTASSFFVYKSDLFTKSQKSILLVFIIFPPLQWVSIVLLLIYNNYQRQSSPETIRVRNSKTEIENTTNQINDLKDLKDKGILSNEEFLQKYRSIEKNSIDTKIKLSEAYKKLKSLYDSGIFSKEEFDNKILMLRNNHSAGTIEDIEYADIFIIRPIKKTDNISKKSFEIYYENHIIDKLPEGYYLHLKSKVTKDKVRIISELDDTARIYLSIEKNGKYYILQEWESTFFNVRTKLEIINEELANNIIRNLKLRKKIVVS